MNVAEELAIGAFPFLKFHQIGIASVLSSFPPASSSPLNVIEKGISE
jgi:hypothetical protein